MSTSKKTSKSNTSTKQPLAHLCWYCDEARIFAIDYTHIIFDDSPPSEYTFAHCEKCNHPSIFVREDMGDGFEMDSYYRTYPPQDRHLGFLMPDIVRQSYEEAVRCETSKTWIACVVMVGRTLEAVCKEFEPNSRTIFDGLRSLHSKGIISQELLEWSNELRVLRNLGAHATNAKVEYSDAKEALDFLQAILEILYDLRPKFEAFKQRRKKTKDTTQVSE